MSAVVVIIYNRLCVVVKRRKSCPVHCPAVLVPYIFLSSLLMSSSHPPSSTWFNFFDLLLLRLATSSIGRMAHSTSSRGGNASDHDGS